MTKTTEHTVLDGRLLLRQPAEGYRAAIDPFFLAASVAVQPGQRVLEPGSGIGTAALSLAARCSGVSVTGVELQAELVRLATANAVHNNLSASVEFLEADINDTIPGLAEASFDHVMANPPYFKADHGQISPNQIKAVANVEGEGGLGIWLVTARRYLKEGGILTFIHTADRLSDLIEAAARNRFGSMEIFPLWSKQGHPAKRIILRSRKGGKGSTVLHSGLVLHEQDGSYSNAADEILINARGLEF